MDTSLSLIALYLKQMIYLCVVASLMMMLAFVLTRRGQPPMIWCFHAAAVRLTENTIVHLPP